MTHTPADLDALAKSVRIKPIEHDAQPKEAAYERAALQERMDKDGEAGKYVPAYVLSVLAKMAPPMGSHAGNLWALYEWAESVVDERDALIAELRHSRFSLASPTQQGAAQAPLTACRAWHGE